MLDADALDVSAIEELDPSLVDGATIIYDREVSNSCSKVLTLCLFARNCLYLSYILHLTHLLTDNVIFSRLVVLSNVLL